MYGEHVYVWYIDRQICVFVWCSPHTPRSMLVERAIAQYTKDPSCDKNAAKVVQNG